VSFAVAAEAYDRFMGRYSEPLAPLFADYAGISSPGQTLDVGCGTGALTAELVRRVGAAAVTCVDPSESFVAAVRQRHPAVTVRRAAAEELPFAPDSFDAALAQLVVHFMSDPIAGLREMARVTRPGGVVSACVWDHAGDHGPLHRFWEVAGELNAEVDDESRLPGTFEGHLAELFREAGLERVEDGMLTVAVEHASFDDWWEPFTLGVGPAGAYVASLGPAGVEELRRRTRDRLPDPPFVVSATAWVASGRVGRA
jgi:SAM-dependent methyltransferase